MKRAFPLLLACLCATPALSAEPSPAQRARAALALAAAARARKAGTDCGCTEAGDCACPPGACHCAACAAKPLTDYAAAYKRAVATGRPLLCFVAGRLPDGERLADYAVLGVVCFANPGGAYRSGLVVARPDGKGGLDEVAVLPVFCAPDDVRFWLTARPQPAPLRGHAPQFFAPRPMLFRGGFGGGGRGGC